MTATYRFSLPVRLLAGAACATLFGYAWFVTQQTEMTFSTRRHGLVTLWGHQLDQYALWLGLFALLPMATWFRSSRVLGWALTAWFLALMVTLYLQVLAPVMP